jgi:hypothetical protein
MKKNTLLEDVNRQRSLMGLPLITEGFEETGVTEEGWGTNLGVGLGLTLLSLIPGLSKAQSPDIPPEGQQGVEKVSTDRPIDSNRLNMILKTLKGQGWISESNVNDIFKYIDHLPSGSWMLTDYATPVMEQTKRGVYQVLNALDNRAAEGTDTPKFAVYKHIPAQGGKPERWEGIGFIMIDRGNTYQTQPSDYQQGGAPESQVPPAAQEPTAGI